MASISSKKREAGKLNKKCLTLDEKIKILDVVKKRKTSCREIEGQFQIGKTQAANVVKQNKWIFKEKASNILKDKTIKNTKPSTQFCTNGLKNA